MTVRNFQVALDNATYQALLERSQSEGQPVEQILAGAGLDTVPPAKVASVDCAHISPSQPRKTPEGFTLHTLWGEIAYRLGGPAFYEIVRQSDEDRAAPGSEALDRLFAQAGPSLILLDETLSYITTASAISSPAPAPAKRLPVSRRARSAANPTAAR